MIEKDETVNAAMYIFLNQALGMSTGKAAAQVAHAAVEAYKGSNPYFIEQWELGGHYTKLVMLARDESNLYVIGTYLTNRGFKVFPIIDEGRTEIDPHSFTALGVEIVNKLDSHTAATFSTFSLYKDSPQKKRWWNK